MLVLRPLRYLIPVVKGFNATVFAAAHLMFPSVLGPHPSAPANDAVINQGPQTLLDFPR